MSERCEQCDDRVDADEELECLDRGGPLWCYACRLDQVEEENVVLKVEAHNTLCERNEALDKLCVLREQLRDALERLESYREELAAHDARDEAHEVGALSLQSRTGRGVQGVE